MFCTKCGRELHEEDVFCAHCGTKVREDILREERHKPYRYDEVVFNPPFREEAERRIDALDRIIQNLYEDKVNGTLTEERFIKLSKNYENEQAELTNKLKILTNELATAQKETADLNKFMRLVKRYTEITELSPEIVRTFIDKIYVHKGGNQGVCSQDDVGCFAKAVDFLNFIHFVHGRGAYHDSGFAEALAGVCPKPYKRGECFGNPSCCHVPYQLLPGA